MEYIRKKTSTSTFPTLRAIREAAISRAEQEYLKELMVSVRGDLGEARRVSGLSRSSFYRLLNKYKIKTNPVTQDYTTG